MVRIWGKSYENMVIEASDFTMNHGGFSGRYIADLRKLSGGTEL